MIRPRDSTERECAPNIARNQRALAGRSSSRILCLSWRAVRKVNVITIERDTNRADASRPARRGRAATDGARVIVRTEFSRGVLYRYSAGDLAPRGRPAGGSDDLSRQAA
jgi:hypothetical protein